MRDFVSNQRDEDDRERVVAATPAAARTPSSSRRSSFSILGAAHSSASNPNSGSQGSFVASFAMARDEQTAYLELARSQLPQLVVECAKSDKATATGADTGETGGDDGGAKWRRLKPKKKNDVVVWEKGGSDDSTSSSSSSSSSRKKKTRGNNGTSTTPGATATATDAFTYTTTRGRDIFADADAFNSPLVMTYAVRSAVRVNAPLDVVLKTLDCSAVTAYRSFTKIIYESLVADTSVLYHSQSPSASTSTTTTVTPRPSTAASVLPQIPSCCGPRESLAVRWMVCRCNNPMVSDCDLCLLEYSKVTSADDPSPPRPRDGKPLFTFRANNNSHNGNQGTSRPSRAPRDGLHDRREFPSAYKILSSVETKSCPELLDSHRLTRCFVPLGGFLFYPTDSTDVTDVVFYMSVAQDRLFHNDIQQLTVASSGNPFSAVSSNERQFRSIQRVLQHMARGVGRIKNAVDAYTMSLRLEMLRNTRWVRNTERAECVCCYRRFHQLTRRRHHCRLCGDVICRDCSVYKDADLPTIGPTILRICKLCDLNELKASSAAAAAALAIEEARRGVTFAGKKLTRKRSTTLNVDTSKATVHDHEPQVGRRFTTVVDGKQRRELPEQAFSCSKADIADRQYKWNTGGGGGKPRVILSPQSAALYASRTGQRTPSFTHTDGGLSAGAASAKAMTPTGRQRTVAPQDWSAAQQHQQSNQSNQQAKSCSKIASTRDRFAVFSFRSKNSTPTNEAPMRRHPDPESDRELDGIGEDDEEKYVAYPSAVRPKGSHLAGNAAIVHPTRVVKSGKLVIPGQEVVDKKTAATAATGNNNQQHEFSSKPLPRKLANVERYEDILLTLCEQVSKALNCKYATLSLFTGIPQQQSSSFAPLTAASLARLASPSATSSPPMSSSPSTPGATGGYENYPAVHFLKASGSKKLAKVAASLMCCAPILELKDKLITRDALANCNMFDFKKLPIVIGPQQVRFYAGIPLVDCSNQMVGAFAVFDSSVYQGSSINEVLPTMEAFAAVALTAIEDRKTDLELQSFLKNPLVDTKGDNQAIRLSEPVFHIDMDAHGGFNDDDDEFFHTDPPYGNAQAIQIRPRFSSRPPPRQRMSPHAAAPARDVEYYKSQMEQLVRQARETEAQMLENSIAMKRQGVAIW
ncbi:hypothetical protein Gpo141_00001076 [Globisporangium polare]